MNIKYLALTFLLACAQVGAPPPRLGWENGWCWNNAIVQLLYNMRGVTECLLKNSSECRQKNRVLEKYIDLITAIRKNPDGYFLEEMRAYHAEWCNVQRYATSGAEGWAVLFNEVNDLMDKGIFACCRDLFEVIEEYTSKSKDLGLSTKRSTKWHLETISDFLVEQENVSVRIAELAGTSYFRLSNVPRYLFLFGGRFSRIQQQFDLAPLLSDELKKTYKTCLYELIGVGVQGTHVTAYIKDQWENNPSWYYCDDMAARNLVAHQEITHLPESGPWPGIVGPTLLVYKRVDVGQDKPQGGGHVTQVVTDNGELEKLVQALHELV